MSRAEILIGSVIWRLIKGGEQALYNLEVRKRGDQGYPQFKSSQLRAENFRILDIEINA